MKFLCRRSSLYDDEAQDPAKKPHPSAFMEATGKATHWMDEELDYQEDPEGKRWFIFLTFASLIDLIREEDKIVIGKADDIQEGLLFLEIYDDYRE